MSKLILLITDEACAGKHLRDPLTKAAPDWEVESAAGREQVQALRKPSVIVLDLMLSTESACDVLHWLRNDPHYKNTPIFVLGSEVLEHDIENAYALGANSCLLLKSAPESAEPIAHGIATYASLLQGPCAGYA